MFDPAGAHDLALTITIRLLTGDAGDPSIHGGGSRDVTRALRGPSSSIRRNPTPQAPGTRDRASNIRRPSTFRQSATGAIKQSFCRLRFIERQELETSLRFQEELRSPVRD